MAVYVDQLKRHPNIPNKRWRWSTSCHLYADSLEELHAFAAKIGLRRSWFQNHHLMPHYDLNPNKRLLAYVAGAIEETTADVKKRMRKIIDSRRSV